ncbi:hypothetical protein [uncultured Martelella sp.]|uniref:hypothetical protein n=1 Tax=uncultured Martelella sp. TaxID=392331 RepID=UPI0029C8A821|nr:hypothetical protein [uncultured Martelella sp.]
MIAGTAQANDQPINPAIKLQNLDTAFERAAAALDTMTTIYAPSCSDGPPASCTFQGYGPLEIHGISDTIDSPPSNISLYWTVSENEDDMKAFVLNVGLLVSVAEPDMEQDDRGNVIAAILDAAAGKSESNIIDGVNADFSATLLGDTVIIVTEKAVR